MGKTKIENIFPSRLSTFFLLIAARIVNLIKKMIATHKKS